MQKGLPPFSKYSSLFEYLLKGSNSKCLSVLCKLRVLIKNLLGVALPGVGCTMIKYGYYPFGLSLYSPCVKEYEQVMELIPIKRPILIKQQALHYRRKREARIFDTGFYSPACRENANELPSLKLAQIRLCANCLYVAQ